MLSCPNILLDGKAWLRQWYLVNFDTYERKWRHTGNKGKVLQQRLGLIECIYFTVLQKCQGLSRTGTLYCLILSKQYANAKTVENPLDSQLLLHLTFKLKIKIRTSKSEYLYLKSGDTLLMPLRDGWVTISWVEKSDHQNLFSTEVYRGTFIKHLLIVVFTVDLCDITVGYECWLSSVTRERLYVCAEFQQLCGRNFFTTFLVKNPNQWEKKKTPNHKKHTHKTS